MVIGAYGLGYKVGLTQPVKRDIYPSDAEIVDIMRKLYGEYSDNPMDSSWVEYSAINLAMIMRGERTI